jgi:hydroxypyruvate isomerase
MQRRTLLGAAAGAAVAGALGPMVQAAPASRIKQGLWKINFGAKPDLTFDQMCAFAAPLEVKGFDVIGPDEWPILKKHGMRPLLVRPDGIDYLTGAIHPEVHDKVVREMTLLADVCKKGGANLIALNAGELRGLTYKAAADNAVTLLKRLAPIMEAAGVEISMENVNDARGNDADLGRKDMAFGHWDWGLEVVNRVNSPNIRLLCDIYHLQIMDGDVSWRLKRDIKWINHMHVAGVPTRKEIDSGQELNFRYIAGVIASLPYEGYVCHEWRLTPGRDYRKSIAEALAIMSA